MATRLEQVVRAAVTALNTGRPPTVPVATRAPGSAHKASDLPAIFVLSAKDTEGVVGNKAGPIVKHDSTVCVVCEATSSHVSTPGTVSAEVLAAVETGRSYSLAHRYLNPAVAPVVTIGTTVLTAGIDYIVEYDAGWIYFIPDAGVTSGDSVSVAYRYLASVVSMEEATDALRVWVLNTLLRSTLGGLLTYCGLDGQHGIEFQFEQRDAAVCRCLIWLSTQYTSSATNAESAT